MATLSYILVLLTALEFDDPAAAEAALRRGDLQQADAICRNWLQGNPGDDGTILLLGLVRFQMGQRVESKRPQEAKKLFVSARKLLEHAESLGARTTAYNVSHMIGYGHFVERRFDAALERFTRALSLTPKSADLYRLRGQCHSASSNAALALPEFERSLELAPRNLSARRQYAQALFDLGRAADARRTFQEHYALIEDDRPHGEDHWSCQYMMYVYSMRMSDLEGARGPLEVARSIDPTRLRGRSELGLLYYRLGELAAAAAEFDYVLAAPAAPPSQLVKSHHYRGLIAKHAGNWQEARDHFEQALARVPKRADILKSYGAVLRRLGENEKARQVLAEFRVLAHAENKIRRLRNQLLRTPEAREARVQLIELLLELDRKDEARTELTQLRHYHPGDATLEGFEQRAK